MKQHLRLEEAAMFGLSIYLFSLLFLPWWYFPLYILAPDIGMLGYVINARIGAFTYNVFHSKLLAIVILLLGYVSDNHMVIFSGIVLFGHASLDRMLGYGLKYNTGFHHTHLGDLKARSDL